MTSTTRSTTRPAWGVWGGLSIVIGGALLFVATLIEVPLSEQSTPGLLGLFTPLFLGSAVAHALSMMFLAGGRTGADGIVGGSMVGRLALLGFGGVFLTSQTVYYVVSYALPPVEDYSGAFALTLVLSVGQLLLLLVASVAIVRAGIATGAARWALLALTAVAVATGAVANTADSFAVATTALLCSTGAQIVVGLVFATTRSRGTDGGKSAMRRDSLQVDVSASASR
ncbi:hypothetical protein [Herbiconiux sp. A18JL235]|uniref:Uncharacterized protein n=1 Tax=Herbiconiux sp. A18JL235 TaxID=3152363 RepID=A0AB39BGI7_9MICO